MEITAIARAGMDISQRNLEKVAQRVASCSGDLAGDIVEMSQVSLQFAVDVKVAKVGQEMERHVVNLLA